MKMFRHGDVLLRESEKKVDRTKTQKQLTIALGEVTGHHHTLFSDSVIYGTPQLFEITTPTPLRHQEHHEVVLPPGVYETVFETEYDPFTEEMKKVMD